MDALTKLANQSSFFKLNGHKKKRRPYRRQMQGGIRVAAFRAFNAAQSYKEGRFPTVAKAARACGTTVAYATAAMIVLDSENSPVQRDVLAGRLPLLAAAKQLRRLAALVKAYRAASATDLPMFGKTVGVAKLFDLAIAPAL